MLVNPAAAAWSQLSNATCTAAAGDSAAVVGSGAAGSVVEDGRSESFEDFTARVLDGLSQVDSPVPLLVAHLGVYRVLCRLLQPGCAEDLLGNALPLRFVLLCDRRWRVEALHRTIGETLS